MFSVLAREGINIEAITTSEIKISCVIENKYGELAVHALTRSLASTATKSWRSSES